MAWLGAIRNRVHELVPLAPFALACLGGGAFIAGWGWAVGFFALALLMSPVSWRWWLMVVGFFVVTGWRGEVLERPVIESLAVPRSELAGGELRVGGLLSLGREERRGFLKDGERVREVMILNGVDWRAGEVYEVSGRVVVPEKERNPGVFSLQDQLRQGGFEGSFLVWEAEKLRDDWRGLPFRWAEAGRERLRDGITRGLGEEEVGRVVIQAMVLGEKPPGESEVTRAFRESGAMHVFAVSGLHVTLVGLLVWMTLALWPIPRRAGVVVVLLAMFAYAMVTGARPPAVRATLMAMCFLGAFFVRRRPSLFNALALSMILVLVWDPSQARDVGFQLSYGVIFSIGLGAGWVLRWTGVVAEGDPFLPQRLWGDGRRRWMAVRRYFAGLSASSASAWLGSLPIMAWHFGIATPVAVLTSLVVIPLTVVILGLGFVGALVGSLVPWAGSGVNRVNGLVAAGAYESARGFAEVPFGYWQTHRMTPADWVVFDCGDGGGASWLEVGDGAMIDVGGRDFYWNQLRSVLRRWQVSPGRVFLTHPDGDHGGALPFLGDLVGEAVLPVEAALSPAYREFLTSGRPVRVGRVGERYRLGEGVEVEILDEAKPEIRTLADDRNMVMKVHWKGWRVLVTGDLGIRDELRLLESGVDLGADVVVMGWHEWGVSGQLHFLEATGARMVIVNSARYLADKMPKPEWKERVREGGYELFDQGETGAVLMDFAADELRAWSYLEPIQELRLKR